MSNRAKFIILVAITMATLTIHYFNIILAPIFGHSHLMHSIHGRLCYIPIVLGAFWFGIYGGLTTASVIAFFSLIYIFIQPSAMQHDIYGEFAEIFFYFAIGGFSGILLHNERTSRNKKEEAERRLAHGERLSMIGQMAASIAHEIKNPLGSIKGAVQILKDRNTPEADRKEFADIIEKEVDRLDGVIQEYLSFARPATGGKTTLDLNEIISGVIKQMSFQCRENNITVRLDAGQGIFLSGHKDRLHQLFLNLILNSIQAMPQGGEIDIKCSRTDGGRIAVSFRDNGPGIPRENQKMIFDPFYSTKTQGTGLGLATVKGIVEEHGGTIAVESSSGAGTSFHICLETGRGAS